MSGTGPGSLREHAARGVAWSTIQVIGTRVVSVGVFLVLARLLTPTAFGLVSLAAVFVSFMEVFVEQGFGEAIIQRGKLLPGHLDSAFWACAALGIVTTLIGLAVAGPLARLMGEPALGPILRALSPTLAITGLVSTAEAILRRELQFGSLAVRTMIGALVGGMAGMVAAFAGMGAWSLVIQALTQSIVGAAVIWLAVPWRPGFNTSWGRLRELLDFSSSVLGMNLLNFFNRQADNLLIAAVLGTTALGYYSVAYRILLMLTEIMARAINSVTLPTFSRIQDDTARLKGGYLMATRISATISTPIFLGLAALAPEVIPVVFGSKWDAAVPVMQILAFIGLLHACIYFSSSVLLSMGMPRKALLISVANAVTNVTAFAIAVHWGIVAVAAAYVIRGYLLAPLPLMLVKHELHFGWREFLELPLVPIGCSAIMVGTIIALRPALELFAGDALRLLLLVLAGAPLYCLSMRTLASRYLSRAADYIAPAAPRLSRLLMWTPYASDA